LGNGVHYISQPINHLKLYMYEMKIVSIEINIEWWNKIVNNEWWKVPKQGQKVVKEFCKESC
jgi:hypothetical protein